ncbi:ZYRO0G02948p [Zygosaccharomyces rouxii]|uniref:ATPase synthesis protein 25, mitochondrial n=1 Tax=Zygosaccharomyces rouxii (strain ATCC 2623 / CBS 732 / NBRC 1130 / NCYC 568 / NRRL Y-229) TaxID=559307 RepID=ATP25_ZYGRC|nr:uncharacterized protein ZYRO0G02948g [Zygosaccharomyces rouxii]C5DZB2.1 RecName: Full=ATPase synthesis protein 25, mitochondrial; Flags: Precursor [Zygosaccharomyces rouxii CBS 732]KAH9202194.1 ATPase synthesis protein 25, mitochondrial [Zygosaccharomyces rouxii]CAR29196.1 ZYRO0G02948p [Zygosaccharomyces rouxii]
MLRISRALRGSRTVGLVRARSVLSSNSTSLRYFSRLPTCYQEKTNNSTTTIPWYLKVGDRERALKQSIFKAQEINYPSNSPDSLRHISQYLCDELGLSDIIIFDLRKGEFETAAAKISDFMVIATARSPKHCQTSFDKLNSLIKQEYESVAYVEGQFNAREEKKRQRRLARKPKLSSNSTSNVPTESWFLIDCKVDKIFVNILTENRRQEINLEELYAPEHERHKYERKESSVEGREAPQEDDILAGLRRLVNQRRQYSTVAPSVVLCRQLLANLESSDFNGAISLINNNREYSLNFMKTIHDWVSGLEIDAAKEIPWKKWVTTFESCWPLVLPEESASLYWSLRMNFFKMINIADKEHYNINQFFNDYLLAKKSLGYPITSQDLIEFFKLTIINVRGDGEKSRGYWEIVNRNALVSRALRLVEDVKDGNSIVQDGTLVSMLLRTMVSGEEEVPNHMLHATYEVIDYLVDTFGAAMDPTAIGGVLEVLAAARSWNKYMAFWEAGVGGLVPGEDHRPWSQFIKLVVDSGDSEMIRKLLSEGHLLWLKRFEVKMTDDIKEQLDRLFEKGYSQGLWFEELKEHIYV